MPVQARTRLLTRLSAYFYPYGKACASCPFAILLLSLLFIGFFSYPVVDRFAQLLSSCPDLVASNEFDAQFWQFSPYIQTNNASTDVLIAQQIRLVNVQKSVDQVLLMQAQALQNALLTTFVHVDGKPLSLSSICLLHRGQCVIHSPLEYWKHDQLGDDWVSIVNKHANSISDATSLSMHPLSVFGNVTLDENRWFLSAESVVLTVFLQQTPYMDTNRIWDSIWHEATSQLQLISLQENCHSLDAPAAGWQVQLDVKAHTIQYKSKQFPYDLPVEVYAYLLVYLIICFVISHGFGDPHLVRSQLGLGFATLFMSIASFTTTIGILNYSGVELKMVPWYLLLVVPFACTLENALLLTDAVVSAGCDMHVKEKLGRALENVGVPMTATLVAEMVILAIGSAMNIPVIEEFCLFSGTVLLVEYILELTFFASVLSIDVKRVELTDLDDRQMSKRLRELAKCDIDADQAPDYCPIEDPPDDTEPKTCAECKQFKTHRSVNALVLCVIMLTLACFNLPGSRSIVSRDSILTGGKLLSMSSQFWNTVNPLHASMSLQINPPYLVLFSADADSSLAHARQYEEYLAYKASFYQSGQSVATEFSKSQSRFRTIVVLLLRQLFSLLVSVNFPSLLLCVVLIGIIMWLIPSWRDQWLLPFLMSMLTKASNDANQHFTRVMRYVPKRVRALLMQDVDDYDEDGVHRGAISAQKQFDKYQHKSNINNVEIKTLSGNHIADIWSIAANAKHGTLVSCGQDGRLVLWDAIKGRWMARLDRVTQAHGGGFDGDLNPDYWSQTASRRNIPRRQTPNRGQAKRMPSARCVKIGQGNKWIASGFDDGVIRVWNMASGNLVRELQVETEIPVTMEDSSEVQQTEIRRRRHHMDQPAQRHHWRAVDRVIDLQFVGAVTEYCHPLVAEAAARQRTASNPLMDTNSSQNYIISVHKSGMIRDWDISSGECINSFPSGHTRDVSVLHVVECKAPHPKLGVTWVFTASKDGVVKCWERRLVKKNRDECMLGDESREVSSIWSCIYTINGHNGHPITTLATESPVGGLGVLVTGSTDGAVKVWNFENGEEICTLSKGGVKRKTPDTQIGGPLSRFSRFPSSDSSEYLSEATLRYQQDESEHFDAADHRRPITKVIVTRYCEVESGPGFCRGCNTCFGNGFLVASCSGDETVHVWRLEKAVGSHESSCKLCSKDYHRSRYKRTRNLTQPVEKWQPGTDVSKGTLSPSTSQHKRAGHLPSKRSVRVRPGQVMSADSSDVDQAIGPAAEALLDIEQLGGEGYIPLAPHFLGQINQAGGRGIAFCDNMILSGVRKKHQSNEWEAWFASLQYYEPTSGICDSDLDDASDKSSISMIPVKTFDLDAPSSSAKEAVVSDALAHVGIWGRLQKVLSRGKNVEAHARFNADKKTDEMAGNRRSRNGYRHDLTEDDDDFTDTEDYTDEADEILPFSTVRHVIPLDGSGIGCDYGNFIKLVYLQDKYRERRLNFAASHEIGTSSSFTYIENADKSSIEANSGSCKCCDKGESPSGGTCCGGSNCGGQCSSVRSRKREKSPSKVDAAKMKRPVVPSCNTAECSTANCARASECHLAQKASSTSTSAWSWI